MKPEPRVLMFPHTARFEIEVGAVAFNQPGDPAVIGDLRLGDIAFLQARSGYALDDPRRWVRHRVSDNKTGLNEKGLSGFLWSIYGADILAYAQGMAR